MSLLQAVKLPAGKGVPLFVEIPVYEESAPYLVTSNKGLVWIDAPFGGSVRSALVKSDWKTDLPEAFREVIRAVVARGREFSWRNSFPNTPRGVASAKNYLRSYGLEPVEILTRDEGVNAWIPEGCAVVVPKDRSYLGVVGIWDEERNTVVVHNPARGIAVLGDW